MANIKDDFSVNDLIDSYAEDNDIDPSAVFQKQPEPQPEEEPEPTIVEQPKKKSGIDPSIAADMPEFSHAGAVYSKDEVQLTENHELKNLADEEAVKEGNDAMQDMQWKERNIEECKRRHHIKYLHIPEGELQVRMLIAASSERKSDAQNQLDEILAEIKELYPEMIEYEDGVKPVQENKEDFPTADEDPSDNKNDKIITPEFGTISSHTDVTEETSEEESTSEEDVENKEADTKIVIDKRSLPEISWTQEDVDKIKKARTVELNIVEGADIKFGNIKDVDTSNVDAVLAKYQRKTNDKVAALPASKYRATFTGLTYPEVIDLSTSNEMNNLDGERKKWSICFDHIRNQSIGAWQEYYLYKDPKTSKDIRVEASTDIPDDIPETDVHFVSRFEDFLRKTSYMDLEFMLWKILCATAMPEEVISIECNSRTNGKVCGNSYDWIYRPDELLSMDSINPAVLEEMKQTGEASTTKEIMDNYKTSPVHANNYVKLKTSGLYAIFGHITGYEYLNDVYGKIKELDNEDNNDPTVVSRAYAYTVLTCVKAFVVPDPDDDGVYNRITGTDNLMKVILSLDEIDWETLSKVTEMMIEPYQMKFVMKDIVCPKCHSKSAITIDSIQRLLFLLARSLQTLNVTLIKQ